MRFCRIILLVISVMILQKNSYGGVAAHCDETKTITASVTETQIKPMTSPKKSIVTFTVSSPSGAIPSSAIWTIDIPGKGTVSDNGISVTVDFDGKNSLS